MFKKITHKKKAFTLIELLVCLFIIGLMMLLIIPNVAKQRSVAQQKADAAIVKVVKSQQQLYMLDKNTTEKPDEDTLLKEKYLTQEQRDAYKKADAALKTDE